MKKIAAISISLFVCILFAGFILLFPCAASLGVVKLTISSQSNNSVTVAWPNTAGYILQTNSSLILSSWGSYKGAISNSSGTNLAVIKPSNINEFFRLESTNTAAFISPIEIPGMAYYWSYRDLPANSLINSWTDEINGLVMTYRGNNVIPPRTTGLFPGLNFAVSGIYAFTSNPVLFGSNFTFWVVMRPAIVSSQTNQAIFGDGNGHGINIFSTNILSSDWGAGVKYSSMKMNYSNIVQFPYGETYDIVDAGGTLYSNGIALAAGLGQPTNYFPFNVLGATNQANEYAAAGYVQYIGIWTNYLLSAADAANLDYWYWNYSVTNVTNGLIAWWKLNDGVGTSAADSWGTNTMYFGGTGNTWTNNAMVDGAALYFSGNGWLTNLNTNFANNLPGMTVSCWVNESGLGGDGPHGAIVQKGAYGGDGGPGFELGADGLSNMAFGCYDIGGTFSETPHSSANPDFPIVGDNNWHFLVGEYTNTPGIGMVPFMYIDGAQITGNLIGFGGVTNTSCVGPVCMGAENYGGGILQGTPSGIINDMRIYSRVLSLEEIEDLYKWRGEPP
jgi:hypothetical protein